MGRLTGHDAADWGSRMPVYHATDQGTMMLLGLMSTIAVSHLHQDSPALDALVLLAGLQVRQMPK